MIAFPATVRVINVGPLLETDSFKISNKISENHLITNFPNYQKYNFRKFCEHISNMKVAAGIKFTHDNFFCGIDNEMPINKLNVKIDSFHYYFNL